jgi:hypothetical protein
MLLLLVIEQAKDEKLKLKKNGGNDVETKRKIKKRGLL